LADFGRNAVGPVLYASAYAADTHVLDDALDVKTEDLLPSLFSTMRSFTREPSPSSVQDSGARGIGVDLFHGLYYEDANGKSENYDDHFYDNITNENEPGESKSDLERVYGSEPELLAMCASSRVIYQKTNGGGGDSPLKLSFEFQTDDRVAALEVASETIVGNYYRCDTPEQRLALMDVQEATIAFPYVNELIHLVEKGATQFGYIQLQDNDKNANRKGGDHIYWWIKGRNTTEEEKARSTVKLTIPTVSRNADKTVLVDEDINYEMSLNSIMQVGNYYDIRYGMPVHKHLELDEAYRFICLMIGLLVKSPTTANLNPKSLGVYAMRVNRNLGTTALGSQQITSAISSDMVDAILMPSVLKIINNTAIRSIMSNAINEATKPGMTVVKPRVTDQLVLYVDNFLEIAVTFADLMNLTTSKKGINYVSIIAERIKANKGLKAMLSVEITETLFGRR
jgi:hypothetical protein